MLRWNMIMALLALMALGAAPAFADGTPGQRVNRGPAPVTPHQLAPPEPGCVLIRGGTAWSCPAAPAPELERRSSFMPCCGTVTRRVVKQHAPVVTKRTVTHRSAPTVTHRTIRTSQRAQASTGLQIDTSGFTGGVGHGVASCGCYGGGGLVVISSGRNSASVLNHRAAQFSFRQSHFSHRSHHGHHGGGKKRRHGKN